MPVYSFQLSAFLAGKPVTVRDAAGDVVTSGTLDGDARFSAELAVGDYVASATDGRYTYRSAGTVPHVDPDSFAAKADVSYVDAQIGGLSSTYALKGETSLPLNRVVLLGDSITNQNSGNIGTSAAIYSARGYFSWANALLRQRFTLVQPSTTEAEFGASGKTTAQLISEGHVAAAAAADADWCIVHAGTNDIGQAVSGADVAANLLTIWQTLIASGKRVVATTILPRAEGTDTAAHRDALREANRLIRANALTTRNVVLCDWYATVVDPATGLANLDYLYDTIHPDAVGASRMGKALADTLSPITSPAAGILPFDNADARSMMPNPFMLGDTSGGATSVNFYNAGAGTHVKSKVARTDGISGEWQQLVVTAANPNADGAQIQQQNTAVGVDWAVGDTVYGICEFETDAAGWAARRLYLAIDFFGSGGVATQALGQTGAETTAMTASLLRPGSGILRTPSVVIPAGTTRLQLNAYLYGAGTVRFGRHDVIKA